MFATTYAEQGNAMTVNPGSIPGNVPLLVPTHGPGDRRPRPLDRDVSTVGRARGCDLRLDASDVSTLHCIIFRSDGTFHVRDCNSRAGTRVNGESIRGDRPLRDGDILLVGPFSFELYVPPSLAPRDPAAVDAAQLQHHGAARRRLAEHALRLRRLLRDRAAGAAQREAEVQRELARLQEKTQVYERRLQELNEADRELEADREQFNARLQKVEDEIADQLAQAERQVREHWQEFQQRCQAEEAAHVSRMQQRETDSMKQQQETAQADTAQQEAQLRGQRAELARMLQELRQLQEDLRQPAEEQLKALNDENERLRNALAEYEERLAQSPGSTQARRELDQTRAENDVLRVLLQERERELSEAMDRLTAPAAAEAPAATNELEPLRAENARLAEQLAEKDTQLAELSAKSAEKPAKSASELERYEAELTQERQELERERAKLTQELEQMRSRNQELDDATREMEMEMSRERAELARERIRMERMRDELKVDMDKLQREQGVRDCLAPVQRLREELNQKRPGAKSVDPAAERLRQLRNGNDTPRA